MVRAAAIAVVSAGLLTACGAVDQDATTTARTTTTGDARKDDLRQAGETFTPDAVNACLERAKTSLGVVDVTYDPYDGGLTAPNGVLEFWLLHTDYGLPGVTMGFVGDPAEGPAFERKALAFESDRVGDDFGRGLVFRQRGNVVFYYDRQTDPEVVRIAQGCLGGPPYAETAGSRRQLGCRSTSTEASGRITRWNHPMWARGFSARRRQEG
jgi:hypothetical protein